MNSITMFMIPFCFGFIIHRASRNYDTATTVVAIIGILTYLWMAISLRG